MKKKLISLIVLSFICLTGLTVFSYAGNEKRLGTGLIADPSEPSGPDDEWKGSYVYFGKHVNNITGSLSGNRGGTVTPVKYRILDKSTDEFNGPKDSGRKTMLLESERGLDINYVNLPYVDDSVPKLATPISNGGLVLTAPRYSTSSAPEAGSQPLFLLVAA